jgi:hypothetical protein
VKAVVAHIGTSRLGKPHSQVQLTPFLRPGALGKCEVRSSAALQYAGIALAFYLSANPAPFLKVITPNATTIFALVLRLRLRSASVQAIGRVRSVVPNHVGDL